VLEIWKPLNANILGLYMSMFKLTMKTQSPKAMVKPFDANPMTKLCIVTTTTELLTERLNECLK
jgi:hypothetical protein